MGLGVLHGGEELGSAGELTRGLLAPYPSVVLAPLARRAAEWRSVADEARRVLERPVRLAHPAHPSVELSEGDAVFIPGGDPALAARQVTPALRAALEGRYVVAASAGAMMLGEEMVSGCPDGCGSLELVPGLGIVEGVITPHAEALDACRMHELRALMGGRVWRRIRTGEALVLCFRARAMLGQVVGGGL